jgi:APA family basic amino acid/polyamine antiporter
MNMDARSSPSSAASPAVTVPQFGLATVVFVVVSSMIGTGVLTTSGFTVALVGSNELMLVLWVIGGVLAACGALTLCELAAAIPESGGEYVFLREAYGPTAGFLSGWVSFLIGFGGPIAASSAASAKYLLMPLGLDAATSAGAELGTASGIVIGLGVIHCLGRRATIRTQATMTILKIGFLVLLAAAGLVAGSGQWATLADRPALSPSLLLTMASSLVYITYAYSGWSAAAYVAGEVRHPQRLLPRGILLGTGLVTIIYLALNTAYALALPAAEIKGIVNAHGLNAVAPIAQLAADRLFGSTIAMPLSVGIGVALLASASAYVITGPRVAAAMAQAGQFPAVAGRVTAHGAPAVATAMQVIWALVLLWTASFEVILLYAGVGLALFSMLSVAAVFVLRVRRPDLPRPFRTPGYPIVPGLYLLGMGLLTIAVCVERPLVAAVSITTIVAGVPVYWLWLGAKGRGR